MDSGAKLPTEGEKSAQAAKRSRNQLARKQMKENLRIWRESATPDERAKELARVSNRKDLSLRDAGQRDYLRGKQA